MFIMVPWYKSKKNEYLVYDTTDLSLEHVSFSQIKKAGIYVAGIYAGQERPTRTAFITCMPTIETGERIGWDTKSYNRILNIDGLKFSVTHIKGGLLIDENKLFTLPEVVRCYLQYVFEFRDCYVFRVIADYRGDRYKHWFTAVYDKNKNYIVSYSEDFSYCDGDINIGIKIDTLSRF